MIREFSVCWNNVYRRIFGTNKWESVKQIQYFCGRLDFVRTFHLRKLQFIRRIAFFDSRSVMMECVSYYSLSKEFKDMVSVYAFDFMKLFCFGIREAVFDVFASLCFKH